MARKLVNPGFMTIAEFARKLGVSGQAVSQAISNGRLRAYDGAGERVHPDYAGRKWLKPAEAVEDWDNRRLRLDDFALQATVTRTTGLRESFWVALGKALEGIVGWTGEVAAAGQNGGQEAISVVLMAKSVELAGSIASLITAAEADHLGDVG
jgi:hypothetical protein